MTRSPESGDVRPVTEAMHGRMAETAVALAVGVVVLLVVSYAVFFAAFAIGGEEAISDTLVGYVAGFSLLGGLVTSFVAFVLAIVSRVRHRVGRLLWLPLALFPALVALVALAEVLLVE